MVLIVIDIMYVTYSTYSQHLSGYYFKLNESRFACASLPKLCGSTAIAIQADLERRG